MDIAATSSHAPIGTAIQSDAAMEAMMTMERQHAGLHRAMITSKPYYPDVMDDGAAAMLSSAPYDDVMDLAAPSSHAPIGTAI